MNYIILIIGIAILIYDGWLIKHDKKSISCRCQELFPTGIDWAIGILGWIGLCFVKHYYPEFDFTIGITIAGFWGHMWLANAERYK